MLNSAGRAWGYRPADSVTFDRYRFEPQTTRLLADGREIKLTRKAAAVLAVLIERAGRPVTRDELFATVWRNRVVSDDALTTCIRELRIALGDDPREPRFIETRHRSGYQFIAATTSEMGTASAPDAIAIAVLPFTDMSAARDQQYFCEGLAQELIVALSNVDGLRVAARSTSFQFRDSEPDVRQLARQPGADALLVGSVRKAGDRVRVTVRLVDAASGYHRWSQRFECTAGDVFAIQDEIAATVAVRLRDAMQRTASVQPEANMLRTTGAIERFPLRTATLRLQGTETRLGLD